jgi:alpha-galactosidase
VAEFFSGYLKLRANGDLKWGLQGGLDMTEEYIGQKHDLWEELKGQASGVMPIADRDNQEAERLVSITEALISGDNHLELAVNMPNQGKISNLPSNAIVEVPAIIGGNGIHGISIGVLPSGIAAVLTQRIHQQEITVEAARTVDRRLAIQALYLDPLVANYEIAKSILDDAVAYAPETMSGFKE